jgi:hypothetical protein
VKGEGYAVGFKLFPEHIRFSTVHHDIFSRLLRDLNTTPFWTK